ncbi:helix-turn-helix domain-containing protein [Xanthomonas euvesicatoria]|uniref:helix-turn-helix domain-containing protein n=1 Tax=Xanthomonas euvesicatoria TaxID=456327 RepID=UPI001C46293B|nr:helix-turn-helix domain-containing protein [Xanthomonas euvesicatoria]MBV6795043.1 helix-turn-helix domain-containing protein [Xanthomonas campestris pv. daturae]
MSQASLNAVLGEQLIDSRQAALMFNLPTYWLSQAKERQQRRIPHYRVGKLVRFKPNELEAWIVAQQASGKEAVDA